MQNKKVIGFYCSSISWGGLEMNIARYAQWMAERGCKCMVFCVENSPLQKKSVELNLPTIAIKKNGKYLDLINAYRVKKLFKKHQVEITWFSDNRDMSLLGLTKKMLGDKLVIFYAQAMRLGIEKKDYLHTIRFNRMDAWVATLPYMAKEVLDKTKLNSHKLFQAPLGIDQKRFLEPKLSRDEAKKFFNVNDNQRLTLGVIGRLDPLKGQLFVLESVISLIKAGLDIQLLIVGESTLNEGEDYEKQIENKITKSQVADRVFLRPFTNKTENFYRAIDIFIMASEGETFGMVTIEAMAAGCAIIGTNSAGTPEILGNGEFGLLYEYNNREEFNTQVEKLYTDRDFLKSIGKKAQQEAIETYSKKSSCQAYEKIIFEVI